MAINRGFTAVRGLLPRTSDPNPNAAYVRCLNRSGGSLSAGDVVILDLSPSDIGPGKPLPVTTTTTPDHPAVSGVVAPGESSVPDGAKVWIQVAGLHPAVQCTNANSGSPITFGEAVSTSIIAKAAGEVSPSLPIFLGWYVDSTDQDTPGPTPRAVLLRNPSGLLPSGT